MDLVAEPSGPLRGRVVLPGDKSISHRALLLGALAIGTTEIEGLLESEDVQATRRALGQLGVRIERAGDRVLVHGVGLGGLGPADDVIDLGNAGTATRLLLGVLAAHGFVTFLTGDASLRRRPMSRVLDPLTAMGAEAVVRDGGRLPLAMIGTDSLRPIKHNSPVASGQIKSAVLLAGLHAPGETSVREPAPSRDHTETMLAAMGAEFEQTTLAEGGNEVTVRGQPELRPLTLHVPADPSSAAFPLVAASLVPGSEVRLDAVGMNPTRAGLLAVLEAMGATVEAANHRSMGGEPVADLVVRAGPLRAIDVPAERAPAMIDEYPILAVAAALATGRTVMHGLGELRVKETDRLTAMATGLAAAGVQVEAGDDWLAVTGTGGAPPTAGIRVDPKHDHRIAMSFAVLGLVGAAPITVNGAETIATSFPDFAQIMQGLGARLTTA